MKLLIWLIIIHSVYCLLVPQEWSDLVKPTITNLRETKSRLSTSLQSLISNHSDNSSEMLTFIPRELMNPNIFKDLGLNNLFKDSHWVNLTNHDQILVPSDFQSFFIFNTSDDMNVPNLKQGFHKFLSKSVPFSLPHLLELVDYYMIIPTPTYSNISYLNGLVSIPRSKLPIFRNSIAGNKKPMVVFMFNQSSSLSKLNTPIITIKNYLTGEGKFSTISNFFDKFANNWIKLVNYDNLIHAVYCNIHESYCLKIKDQSVDIFPTTPNTTDTQIETQAIRQIHDILSVKADRFNDISYEFAHTPKTAIEKADEKLDRKVDEKITRIHDVKESMLEKIDNRKTNWLDRVESKLDNLDDKTDFIADKIKTKAKIMKKYKIHPKLFDKEEEQQQQPVIDIISELELSESEPEAEETELPSIYNNKDINNYISKRNQYFELRDIVKTSDGTITIPLSLLRLDSFDPPRTTTYSQVIIDTQQPLAKREEDCQPITWYNIFHYSIFGEPKFCKEKLE